MKKIIGVILTIVILTGTIFTLSGCGNDTTRKPPNNDTEKVKENSNKNEENNNTIASKNDDNGILANVVKVGDYVNYNASTNGEYTYTTDKQLTGVEDDGDITTFKSTEELKWKVLSVNKEKGTVNLVSDDTVGYLYLNGKKGYENSVKILNEIGAIYGKGKGAKLGRSINVEDLNNAVGYKVNNPDEIKHFDNLNITEEDKFDVLPEGMTINGTSISVPNKSYGYAWNGLDYCSLSSDQYITLFRHDYNGDLHVKDYWVADITIDVNEYENSLYYIVRTVNNGDLGEIRGYSTDYGETLYSSSGHSNYRHLNKVEVVVELQTNIKTNGKDENGVWQLDI